MSGKKNKKPSHVNFLQGGGQGVWNKLIHKDRGDE